MGWPNWVRRRACAERQVEGGLPQAHGLRPHRRAEDVERPHRDPPAVALGAEPVVRGDAAALEASSPMTWGASVCMAVPGEARGVLRDDEGREPLGAGLRARPGEHHVEAGDGRVRDEALRAREHPVIALALRARREGGGVRSRLGLGQRERRNRLASGQRREPAPLLRLGAREEDGVAPQPLDREQLLGGRARPGELLADEAEGHRPERPLEAAPVGDGHQPGKEALAAEGAREIPVELVPLSPRLGEGPEDLGARPGDGGPERPLLRQRGRGRRHGSVRDRLPRRASRATRRGRRAPTYVSKVKPSPSTRNRASGRAMRAVVADHQLTRIERGEAPAGDEDVAEPRAGDAAPARGCERGRPRPGASPSRTRSPRSGTGVARGEPRTRGRSGPRACRAPERTRPPGSGRRRARVPRPGAPPDRRPSPGAARRSRHRGARAPPPRARPLESEHDGLGRGPGDGPEPRPQIGGIQRQALLVGQVTALLSPARGERRANRAAEAVAAGQDAEAPDAALPGIRRQDVGAGGRRGPELEQRSGSSRGSARSARPAWSTRTSRAAASGYTASVGVGEAVTMAVTPEPSRRLTSVSGVPHVERLDVDAPGRRA